MMGNPLFKSCNEGLILSSPPPHLPQKEAKRVYNLFLTPQVLRLLVTTWATLVWCHGCF
jgi:hypothetical protein